MHAYAFFLAFLANSQAGEHTEDNIPTLNASLPHSDIKLVEQQHCRDCQMPNTYEPAGPKVLLIA